MLELIFDRLNDAGSFTRVEVAESVQAISGRIGTAEDGQVFVVPWRERARPNRNAAGGHRQLIEVQFVTAMVSRQHDDPRGAERAARFDGLKAAIEELLAGWHPDRTAGACALVGGETTGLGNGVSIYAQTWQTTRFLTGEPHG